MGYEDAPATRMLAVYCAMCGKDLVDATSVETGIGPICRRKFGFPDALDEDTRSTANKLVHFIAIRQDDSPEVRNALDELDKLGCAVIVDRISKRLYGKHLSAWLEDGRLVIKSPFSNAFLDTCRSIRSRRWDSGGKVTTFDPADHRPVACAIMGGYNTGSRIIIGATKDELPKTGVVVSDGMFDALCDGYKPEPEPPKLPTPVKVVRDEKTGRIAVSCPYERSVVEGMKQVEGRRWDGGNKLNTFPIEAEDEVLDIVRAGFDSIYVVTEKGVVAAVRKSRGGRGRGGYAYYGNGGRCEDAPCCGCC